MVDLSRLNKSQHEAVVLTEGPVLVIAGAGTGKTSVLTTRIAYIIGELGVDPNKILAFTFTNKAAEEMNLRVAKMLNGVTVSWIGTYHSTCLRILKHDIKHLGWENNFSVVDEDDKNLIIKNIIKENQIILNQITIKKIVQIVSLIKSNDIKINENNISELMELFEIKDIRTCHDISFIYKAYNKWLKKINSLDFDDLINFTYQLLKDFIEVRQKWQNKFEYILIDEFQDTNFKQFEIINFLVNSSRNVFAVGDPNQTIYTWRGAYPEIIEDFVQAYDVKTIVKLYENYRSTEKILNAANNLIIKNKQKYRNDLIPHNNNDYDVNAYIGEYREDEASYIAKEIKRLYEVEKIDYSKITILYRANYVSRLIEEQLISQQIPYIIYGSVQFYQRKEIKDLISYIKAIFQPDDVSLIRIINTPKRKIGDDTVNTILKWANDNKTTFKDAIRRVNEINSLNQMIKIRISNFVGFLDALTLEVNQVNFSETVDLIIQKVNYIEYLKTTEVNVATRFENINELKESISNYCQKNIDPNPIDFLNKISLYSSFDSTKEPQNSNVKLMTVHMAKGLEFDTVFIYCFNEGVFPSNKSLKENEIQEERRIAYVAITRAINRLYITSTKDMQLQTYPFNSFCPSRFLDEIHWKNLNKVNKEIKSLNSKDLEWYNSKKPKTYFDEKKVFTNEEKFQVGDVIVHTIFGTGVISSAKGPILEVIFKAPYGKKSIVAKHNSIKRLVS